VSTVSAEVSAALRELRRRARARESLHTFALSIEIPTVIYPNTGPMCPDEDMLAPARELMALHHALILDVLQRCVTKEGGFGRCMIFAPPGTAKSMYTSVITPAWVMGRSPKTRIILGSYGADIAEKQSRRVQDIVRQEYYRQLFLENPKVRTEAAGDWSMTNGSEMLALGITGGVTGNRANGLIIDDPIAGREEADSEANRKKVLDAYTDDCKSRLLEGAWIALIMTRWHEQDLAGSILPDDYDGRSGVIRCKDGMDWEVLNLQAKCERHDDPLGRKPGEYIWPEYYSPKHWHQYELATGNEAARAWDSLYQQRPTPRGDGRFTMEMLESTLYKPGTQPVRLAKVGAGDYAVTPGKNDFTELGVFGMDINGVLWEVDWWHEQCDTGVSADKTLDLVALHRIPMWFHEGGPIDKAMSPLINLRMRQRARGGEPYIDEAGNAALSKPDRRVIADMRALPSQSNKTDKVATFKGMVNAGMVRFRDNANSRRIFAQLIAGSAGRHDDAHDVCGLIGRAVDQFPLAAPEPVPEATPLKAFSAAWLEYEEPSKAGEYRLCI
jgi:hypothetical protein